MLNYLILIFSSVALSSAASLPASIQKCQNDDKLNDCIMENSKEAIAGLLKGEPTLGIPVLDPLKIEKIEQTSSGSRSVSLNFSLSDVEVKGLTNAELVKSEFDAANKIIQFSVKIPQLVIASNYNLNGKFLVVPVTGNGKLTLTIDELDFTYSMNYGIVEKDGVEFVSPNFPGKLTYTSKKVTPVFENLFNGDQNLGDSFNKMVDENWQEWDAQVGPGIADALAQVIGTLLKRVTDAVPYKEMFL
ncbi:circadian clock-controlled protein daywake [Halyomorpha halys]|uniref:circadian clock-controlled protein daywake n=1 Tax=Halyomorpha halys TaxID=286706 RepID=UPI0006D4DC7D|nr:protein takeout-like [Halyomorpha halys]